MNTDTMTDAEARYQTWLNGPATLTHEYRGRPSLIREQMTQDINFKAAIGYDPGSSTSVPGKHSPAFWLFLIVLALTIVGLPVAVLIALVWRPSDAVFLTFQKRAQFS